MSVEQIDAVVIGAGVVGLACARALALSGREVIVLEAAGAIGTGTSSRNSEVIHAGIYYPAGSLKARACVSGKRALYAYCASHGVEHRRCGKLIVATDESQLPGLKELSEKAAANGVDDLTYMTPREAAVLEPAVRCVGALFSPSTGILDSHGLMLAYQGDAEAAGAMLAFDAPVLGGAVLGGAAGIRLEVGGAAPMELEARTVVNSAGLGASAVAASLSGLPAATIPRTWYAKGNYYTLAGRSPFGRLIYPMPEKAGLGVHVTVDLGGQARFGPDVEWVDSPDDYDVDPRRAEAFYDAVRRYWPELPDGALLPGYAGMRPKLQAPGEPAADFLVQGSASHGVPGLVNLYGIESPGLTASLALAGLVLERLAEGASAAA
ncbi:L-2-hydroxyglutarate oxidase LhgO [Tistlia consotensis]|uniref:L-2-hydroxyglutarate oxidase LhgO n=1 Tax=Tistlia consotensis USBA 355 TaxID=560819 RepID=A0A1Y6B963_9PROT|nr:NAD(P)/FAD-dependent oxidoreductase [Tistlia consotensis]SME97537.1 L-2-hydroxyglutarate oxidase LhgO [Tistlia consotensis USBA 355]SNR56858.1 L-2-hydroxyglutarate oxidase LhgO [Tistlia consotensis]